MNDPISVFVLDMAQSFCLPLLKVGQAWTSQVEIAVTFCNPTLLVQIFRFAREDKHTRGENWGHAVILTLRLPAFESAVHSWDLAEEGDILNTRATLSFACGDTLFVCKFLLAVFRVELPTPRNTTKNISLVVPQTATDYIEWFWTLKCSCIYRPKCYEHCSAELIKYWKKSVVGKTPKKRKIRKTRTSKM